jgi:hypothetical protein
VKAFTVHDVFKIARFTDALCVKVKQSSINATKIYSYIQRVNERREFINLCWIFWQFVDYMWYSTDGEAALSLIQAMAECAVFCTSVSIQLSEKPPLFFIKRKGIF